MVCEGTEVKHPHTQPNHLWKEIPQERTQQTASFYPPS